MDTRMGLGIDRWQEEAKPRANRYHVQHLCRSPIG